MPDAASPDDDHTRIIRRQPQDPGSRPTPIADEPQTSIIRRHPTGAIPTADEPATTVVPRARPVAIPATHATPRTAIVTATLAILAGWATGVIAADLIAGWWSNERLFCVAVGFLAAVSAAANISGVIALLLRRRMGRLLVIVGAVIGLLIFGSLFVAGAELHPVAYAMPVLPVAAIVCAVLPATGRWAASNRPANPTKGP